MPKRPPEYVYVYRVVNTVNGMKYVGITENPRTRMHVHAAYKSRLGDAIREHGRDKFRMEILEKRRLEDTTDEQLWTLEAYHIEKEGALFPNGYNSHKATRAARDRHFTIDIGGSTHAWLMKFEAEEDIGRRVRDVFYLGLDIVQRDPRKLERMWKKRRRLFGRITRRVRASTAPAGVQQQLGLDQP